MTKKQTSSGFSPFLGRDMPAVRSGLFVVLWIIAALLNIGAFLLLLVARETLRVVRLRERRGYTWSRTCFALVSADWFDVLLFSCALLLVVYEGAGSFPPVVILSGMAIVLLKGWLMLRLLPQLLHPMTTVENEESLQELFSVRDRLGYVIILAAWFLILISPAVLPGGWQTVVLLLKRELVPWRI